KSWWPSSSRSSSPSSSTPDWLPWGPSKGERMTVQEPARTGCPVEEYSTVGPRQEPLFYFKRFDELRERRRPFFRTESGPGYYVFLDHDVILEGLQHPELFSSAVIVPEEPNPPYKWIPIML